MTQAPTAPPRQTVDPSPAPRPTRRRRRSAFPWRLTAAGLLVVAVIALFVTSRAASTGPGPSDQELLHEVSRGDLRISVVESGSLESGNAVVIKSALEGRVQILRLVEEGTFVSEGDILCELDASDLREREIAKEIDYERAHASYVAATKDHEILKSDGESETKRAELDVYFARMDLKKYEEGDWPQSLREARAAITIAEEELKRARDKEEWSRKLADKGYITRQELEADQLAVTKRQLDLTLAEESLRVLTEYTHEKDLETLRSNLEEAEKELGRVVARVEGQIIQSEADLKSKKATLDLETERLKKLRDQIDKATIRAPQDGLVVYGNSSGSFGRNNEDPIQEGSSIRERQTIFKLPDVTNMVAKIKVHESAYDRVSEGLKAYVTLDAFPEEVYPARVTFVAPLPDSQQWWMNPDLKVYSADVRLGRDTTKLKPGMSCSVEIEVDTLEGVISVPIQAIFRRGETNFCYVKTDGGIRAKPVSVGLHNDRSIHVLSGLKEGDRVFLASPAGAEEIEVPEGERVLPRARLEEADFPEAVSRESRELTSDSGLDFEAWEALPDDEKRGAFPRLSEEDRAKAMGSLRQRMSPEMLERMRDMSPEDLERMREADFGPPGGGPPQGASSPGGRSPRGGRERDGG